LHGVGTQRVEEELTQIFPEARILRMDLDTTTTRGSHGKILQAFGQGEADILLGTQMVAKGLDFSRVTLVGVISADVQMLLPDFRSAERTFQLLTQVAGRAGRSVLPGEVIIQSFRTDHYALKHVLMHDFVGFFEEEVRFRREAVYPPDAKLILIELKSRNEKVVQETAQALGRSLKRILSHHIILGPVSAVISRIRGDYRWHLIIKTVRSVDPSGTIARSAIRRILYGTKQNTYSTEVKITVDVDPYSIL
jgi:primosomal protein N' (replication factor Y)